MKPIIKQLIIILLIVIISTLNSVSFVKAINTDYVINDHLGSASVIIDSVDDSVVWSADYEPFGSVFNEQKNNDDVGADAVNNRFSYNAKEQDDSTGFFYYDARYYDAGLGRFLSADSIIGKAGNPQELNRYAYVKNNPLGRIDPTGNQGLPNNGLLRVIHSTRKLMNSLKGVSSEGPYCNTGAALACMGLSILGLEKGRDFDLKAGYSHVFIQLKDGTIIDPTFIQFFKKGSSAYKKILSGSGGFIGTKEERDEFLIKHRTSLSIKGRLKEELDAPFKNPALSKKEAEQQYLNILNKVFFGEETNPEKNLLIRTANDQFNHFVSKAKNPDYLFLGPFKSFGKTLQEEYGNYLPRKNKPELVPLVEEKN